MTTMTKNTAADIWKMTCELDALQANLDFEQDLARQASLKEEIRDTMALLDHLTYVDGRGGEDFVNDSVFHTGGR